MSDTTPSEATTSPAPSPRVQTQTAAPRDQVAPAAEPVPADEVTLCVMWPTAQYNYPLNVTGDPETDEWLEVTQDGVRVSRTVAEAAIESTKPGGVSSVLYIAEDRNEG